MADQKLSELTELAATPANDDEVYIRDVSEAAADESKRITIANLIAAYLLLSGGTLTGNLTMGAGLKITIADDGKIQVGTQAGSPVLFAGHPTYEQEVYVQAKDGNHIGELGVYPKGTEDRAILEVSNAEDLDNCGVMHLSIEGLDARLYGFKTGTGTAPTSLSVNINFIPFDTTGSTELGDASHWWKHVKALKHYFYPSLSAEFPISGQLIQDFTAGENLVLGDAVYIKNDGKAWKSDADGAATMPIFALAAATIDADASGDFLLQGFLRKVAWDWTPGGLIYASVTPGELSQTAPVGSGDQVQVVGVASHADFIYFNPSLELVEIS